MTTPDERSPRLTQIRDLKMARSVHAYVRGSTVKFYEWLDGRARKVPEGPPVSRQRRLVPIHRWHHLAAERLDTVKPVIPLGKNFWGLMREERVSLRRSSISEL
jgi:Uncharacterized protein conserved in bacteria (DUF2252)